MHAWESLARERSKHKSENLVLWSVVRTHLKENILIAFYALLRTIAVTVSPLILYAFVNYSNRKGTDLKEGLSIMGFLIVSKVVDSVFQRHWFFDSRRSGLKMRSALMVAVYRKQLKLSSSARRRHSTGEIVNYIAVDAYRMGEFPWWFHMTWTSALQVVLSIGILFGVVGVGALPGLVPLVICGLINIPFARIIQNCMAQFMISQDERLRSTSEILNSMKIIKLQSWEDKFKNLVENLREEEFIWLSKALIMKAYGSSVNAVKIQGGNFIWDHESVSPTLMDVNVEIKWGQKIAVCGPVGAGKSSLLHAVLGEIPKISGTVNVSSTIAYVSQTSWIQSGTVRDNILFGKPMDKTRYENAIKVCALDKDIKDFSHGDLTEIGQRGINMSGGQKQRIQLARAVYNDADIYLLDDPFSAVDAHTAAILFNDCVMTALREKTVVLVTHQVEFLSEVDTILVMEGGKVTQSGNYEDLLTTGAPFEQLVSAHKEAISELDQNNENKRHIEESQGFYLDENQSEGEISNEGQLGVQLTQEEEKEIGDVGWKTFRDYISFSRGTLMLCCIILAQSVFVALQTASTFWLALAIEVPKLSSATLIGVYSLISFASSAFVYLRSLFTAYLGLRGSAAFFSGFTTAIFNAPMLFFDSTPVGRILTRASSGFSILDFDIPFFVTFVAAGPIEIVAIIYILVSITWHVLIVAVPAMVASKYVQGYYQASARELIRINGTTKAPVMNFASETSLGVVTVRAYNMADRFFKNYLKLVETDATLFFHSNVAMEWLVLRIEALQNLTVITAALLLILAPQGYVSPGLVGLSLSYAFTLTGSQIFLTRWYCNLLNYLISVERIKQFIHLPAEPPSIVKDNRPPSSWPSKGRIDLQALEIRYRPNAPLVLKGITCTFKEGSRVGVVGRTGSGKSTLISALFRLVEPANGDIVIDGINICSMGLKDLRMKLSIIPQEPTLFKGSIRTNLDPLGLYSDDDIWKALEKCQLKETISRLPNLLDSSVSDEGGNWSLGQRQLFCLGRILLKRNKILVLDEATASVDSATDVILQRIIRQEFAECTVITVAHRDPTVIDSDMVMVLSYDNFSRICLGDFSLTSFSTQRCIIDIVNIFFLGVFYASLLTNLIKKSPDCVMTALRRKTVILVTHQVVEGGKITQSGSYEDLLTAGTAFEQLLSAHREAITGIEKSGANKREFENVVTVQPEDSHVFNLAKGGSDGDISTKVQLTQEEEKEIGDVGWKPFCDYILFPKGSLFLCLSVLGQLAFVGLQAASTYWLALASEISEVTSSILIGVYSVISFLSIIFVYLRSYFAAHLGLKASKAFFCAFTDAIFNAPMLFFDSTPVGRILTRASSDLSILDFDIPFTTISVTAEVTELLTMIGIMVSITWQVLIVAVLAMVASKYIQGYYQASAREIIRINGTTKAPLMNFTAETSLGVVTIRAFNIADRFFKNYLNLVDTDATMFFHSNAAIEWLILWVEVLQNLTLFTAALLLVLLPKGYVAPGLVGLSLSYAFSLTATQVHLTRMFCNLSNYVISVERIKQFIHIPAEPIAIVEDNRPPASWPSKGRIDLQSLEIRYRPNAPLVLKGISCTFKEGSRVGVVGRTGSGKTTLISALFRLVEPSRGDILIDGINICSIGLKDLRSKLSIIPQEPTLFKGSIRNNLDPLALYSDDEIWKALEKCQLKAIISSLPNLLDTSVSDEGDNWSVGQRQLICLGRVLLKKNIILVLDEATASIDSATDVILQRVIRQEFSECTVITVAHRVPTVIDSDMVMVLSYGKLVEYDKPSKLIDTNSSFSKLVAEYWSNCHTNLLQKD
uniref:ABC-type xenobiotic transporter n=1 Tax=Cajanus cajan TaxID=3821 RepID=A0A151SHL5_CAJCA|nr:ABC transporter C family member 8 [Cajanus cajan]